MMESVINHQGQLVACDTDELAYSVRTVDVDSVMAYGVEVCSSGKAWNLSYLLTLLGDYLLYPSPGKVDVASSMMRLEMLDDWFWGNIVSITLQGDWTEARAKELVRSLWVSMDRVSLSDMNIRLYGSFGVWEAICSGNEDEDNEDQRARVSLRLDME